MTAGAHALSYDNTDRPIPEARVLVMVVLALMAFGVLMVYSASRSVDPADGGSYFVRHLLFLPIAIVAMAFGACVPYHWLNRGWLASAIFVGTVGLLGLVLFFGDPVNGARRWFSVAVAGMRVSFQPSELAKVALVVFLAWFFSRPGADVRSFRRSFLPAMGAIGVVGALIVKEDFGTAALVGLVAVLLCLIAGCRWWHFLTVLPFAGIGFWLTVVRVEYRWDRLIAFLDPWAHQDGAGWHITQSLMGIGRGGFFGVGLGAGIQKYYIPECETDFIFSVLCEEAGLLGAILVLGLFGVFVWRAGRVLRRAPDRFGFLLAAGALLTIGLQAVMNIGVVTSALPAKGIGLPFISYGGSGLVMMSLAAGLIASVARQSGLPGRPLWAGAASGPPPLVRRRTCYGR
jgi:cell division protein FtsW